MINGHPVLFLILCVIWFVFMIGGINCAKQFDKLGKLWYENEKKLVKQRKSSIDDRLNRNSPNFDPDGYWGDRYCEDPLGTLIAMKISMVLERKIKKFCRN